MKKLSFALTGMFVSTGLLAVTPIFAADRNVILVQSGSGGSGGATAQAAAAAARRNLKK